MIEKKTVSLYLNNMMQALKMKMFQPDYNKPYLILAQDVINCVENIDSIIQKEPLPEGTITHNTPEIKQDNTEEIKKIIESLTLKKS